MLLKFQIKGKAEWFDALDELVAASGDINRADLLERLVMEEAERRGVAFPSRLDPSIYNSFARQKLTM